MPKSTHKNAMFLEDIKLYVLGKDQGEIAKIYNINRASVNNRITQTFYKLINHFEFKEKNIAYPHVHGMRSGRRFKNASKYSEFWLYVIDSYEKGIEYKSFNF